MLSMEQMSLFDVEFGLSSYENNPNNSIDFKQVKKECAKKKKEKTYFVYKRYNKAYKEIRGSLREKAINIFEGNPKDVSFDLYEEMFLYVLSKVHIYCRENIEKQAILDNLSYRYEIEHEKMAKRVGVYNELYADYNAL